MRIGPGASLEHPHYQDLQPLVDGSGRACVSSGASGGRRGNEAGAASSRMGCRWRRSTGVQPRPASLRPRVRLNAATSNAFEGLLRFEGLLLVQRLQIDTAAGVR